MEQVSFDVEESDRSPGRRLGQIYRTARSLAQALRSKRQKAAEIPVTAVAPELPNWEDQLGIVVGERVRDLWRAGARQARNWDDAYQLTTSDETRIRLTAISPVRHIPARVPMLDIGEVPWEVLIPLVPGAGTRGSRESGWAISSTRREDDTPLAFMIDTHVPASFAVDATGNMAPREPEDVHYEAFREPDGLRIYRLGADDRLAAVGNAEGQRLLWQMNSCTPAV
jgi:hypothetical protein